jgi:hypothetical protein
MVLQNHGDCGVGVILALHIAGRARKKRQEGGRIIQTAKGVGMG